MKRALTFLHFSCRFRYPLYLALLAALVVARHVAPPPVAAQSPAPVETGFLNGEVTDGVQTMVYLVYVPRDYSPEKQWPVILFLHGGGGSGADGFGPAFRTLPLQGPYSIPKSIIWGGSLGTAVMRNPQRFPCLVVWPERPAGNDYTAWSGHMEDLALRALEEVVAKYNGDRNRLYVTGISLGGYGTWNFATDHPDLFAAAMPICGCADYLTKKIAQALKSLPIWVFHGDKDSLVPVSCSRTLVAAVRAAGNPNVQYTEYPGVDHNCWDIAYNDPKVIEWLLAQKR